MFLPALSVLVPLQVSLWLGIAFAAIGIAAALLAAWLWTFPMAPDPGGTDPNGRSTAPRSWSMVHRWLGYSFVVIYLILMVEMTLRFWRYESEWKPAVILHAAMGMLVGPIVIAKILILRRFKRFGNRLPIFGGVLCLLAVSLIGLVAWPALRLSTNRAVSTTANSLRPDPGQMTVLKSCLQCHGSSQILNERRDREDWAEIFDKMQSRAEKGVGRREIPDAGKDSIVSYLLSIAGENADAEVSGQRRRRRGQE
jgi:hypothetical protein